MIFSLNEIDVHCKKAARGAGFEWGHAEEIGKVIRWLAMYDLPGVSVFASYLTNLEFRTNKYQAQNSATEKLKKKEDGNGICPVLKGAYLCDQSSIELPENITIQNLKSPLLLLPYLAFIAGKQQKSFSFKYEQSSFYYGDDQLRFDNTSSCACGWTQTAQFYYTGKLITGNREIKFEQNIDEKHWQILNQFVGRTYVPASEVSRQGAGSDEDRTR